MTEKEKRRQQRRAEDAVFNRMLVWLLVAAVAEVVILLVKRIYLDYKFTDFGLALAFVLADFFKVYAILGLVLTVAGVVWAVMHFRSGKAVKRPVQVTGIVAAVWIISVLTYYMHDTGMRILMVLPAVAAVLILIYFLYQRAFFVNAVLAGGGMAALWLLRRYAGTHPTALLLCFVAGWIVLAVVAVLAVRLKKTDGKLGKMQLMPERSDYTMILISCAFTALAMLLGMILGAGPAYYLFFVMIAWLFCQAVYFTVKLM